METITLQTKEQLNIFMNPQRQRLLRVLAGSARPRTPKELSAELGVSPSSVQHHLKKLESLGLVFIDHTEVIHGITARFYAASRVTVHIGGEERGERETLLKSLVAGVLDGALASIAAPEPRGDVLTGVAHLTPERAQELQAVIRSFLQDCETPCDGSQPWEYALTYYPMGWAE